MQRKQTIPWALAMGLVIVLFLVPGPASVAVAAGAADGASEGEYYVGGGTPGNTKGTEDGGGAGGGYEADPDSFDIDSGVGVAIEPVQTPPAPVSGALPRLMSWLAQRFVQIIFAAWSVAGR
jgi:hypothetical protein